MQQIRLTKDRLTYDDVRGGGGVGGGSGLLAKDADLSPFAVASTLLGFEGAQLSVADQANLMFQDMDLIPLLIQENYLNHRPKVAGSDKQRMQVSHSFRRETLDHQKVSARRPRIMTDLLHLPLFVCCALFCAALPCPACRLLPRRRTGSLAGTSLRT